jgi:MATE family multidrug resistance protein
MSVLACHLHWLGLSPESAAISQAYILITAVTVPLSLLQRIFQMQANASGQQKRVMWLNLSNLSIKALLSWLLIYGHVHTSVQGAIGAALASGVALLLLFPWFVRGLTNVNGQRPWHLLLRTRRLSWPHLKPMLAVGVPNSITTLADVIGYTAMAILIARMGTEAAGAHQIVANFTALMFFVPFSLATACCILVNKEIGAGRQAEAVRLAHFSLRLSLLICFALASVCVLARPLIAHSYTNDPAIHTLVLSVMFISCAYHLFDGQLAMIMGMLRCFGITKMPMLIYVAFICLGALTLGWVLAYHGLPGSTPLFAPMGVHGFWLAAGLCAASAFCLLQRRLHQLLKHATDSSNQRA